MSDDKSNDERIAESLERITRSLEEIAKWTKVTSIPKVKDTLKEFIKTPEDANVYNLSDGERTTREMEKLTKVGRMSVARLWKKWIRAGLAEPIPSEGGGNRAKSLFSLEDFDIECPNNPQNKELNNEAEDQSNTQDLGAKLNE